MRGSAVRRTLVVVALAAGCVVTTRSADADLSALQPRVDRLEALTQRVEALSAIKRLQHAYGHYSELGLWHDFADLFADSGIFGVAASTGEREVTELLPVVLDELRRSTEQISEEEVVRVRNQIRAGLLMSLESPSSRAGQLAQIGRAHV